MVPPIMLTNKFWDKINHNLMIYGIFVMNSLCVFVSGVTAVP